MRSVCWLPLLLTCTACAPYPMAVGHHLFGQAMPFCRVMVAPSLHQGTELLVSGLYVATPHGGMIYDVGCENDGIYLDNTEGMPDEVAAWRILGAAARSEVGARTPVVIRGVLSRPPCNAERCSADWRLTRAQLFAADGTRTTSPRHEAP